MEKELFHIYEIIDSKTKKIYDLNYGRIPNRHKHPHSVFTRNHLLLIPVDYSDNSDMEM